MKNPLRRLPWFRPAMSFTSLSTDDRVLIELVILRRRAATLRDENKLWTARFHADRLTIAKLEDRIAAVRAVYEQACSETVDMPDQTGEWVEMLLADISMALDDPISQEEANKGLRGDR